MEQLRSVGIWLKRYHFWVLTALATLIAVACWWKSASSLSAAYKTNKGTIDSAFSSLEQVRSKPFHANEDVNKRQEEQIALQKQRVKQLWDKLYDRQRTAVLKWPDNLSPEFRTEIEKLKFGDAIPRNLRSHYNNYINDHFPKLPEIVGARDITSETVGGGGGGGRGMEGMMRGGEGPGRMMGGREGGMGSYDPNMPQDDDYVVQWLDQQRIRDELYNSETPTAKKIWKTQEDLWVYEALLGIIARTNEEAGSDRASNAAVRIIEALEVGRLAAQEGRSMGRIDMEMPVAGPMGEGGEPGAPPMSRGGEFGGREGMMMGGEGGMSFEGGERGGAADAAAADAALFDGRYVDEKGQPIAAAGEITPVSFGKEFKRLPIRMQLYMDQRRLPELITECANAPLQVEVEQVRINPTTSGGAGGGFREGGRSGASTSQPGEPMVPEHEPHMKRVVIQGIISIFNPPTDDETTTEATPSGQVAGVQ